MLDNEAKNNACEDHSFNIRRVIKASRGVQITDGDLHDKGVDFSKNTSKAYLDNGKM